MDNHKKYRSAFTLIEIIIALAIVTGIFSAVYGAWFAASRSVRHGSEQMAQTFEARTLLEKMTRQLRCAFYTTRKTPPTVTRRLAPSLLIETPDDEPTVFLAGNDLPGDLILKCITTSGIFYDASLPNGPFDVAYKLDARRHTLYYSQQPRRPPPPNQTSLADRLNARNWFPIAENIYALELTFYDGKDWQKKWDSRETGCLPHAVKITLTINKGPAAEKPAYQTNALINCHPSDP